MKNRSKIINKNLKNITYVKRPNNVVGVVYLNSLMFTESVKLQCASHFEAMLNVCCCFFLCLSVRCAKSSQIKTVSSSNIFFKGSRFRYRWDRKRCGGVVLESNVKNIHNVIEKQSSCLEGRLPTHCWSPEKCGILFIFFHVRKNKRNIILCLDKVCSLKSLAWASATSSH